MGEKIRRKMCKTNKMAWTEQFYLINKAKHVYEMPDSVIHNNDKLKTKLLWKINPMRNMRFTIASCKHRQRIWSSANVNTCTKYDCEMCFNIHICYFDYIGLKFVRLRFDAIPRAQQTASGFCDVIFSLFSTN